MMDGNIRTLKNEYEEEKNKRVYLTQEEVDALALTPEELREAELRGSMLGFYESLLEDRFDDAQVYIGLLISQEVPDIPYYIGMVKQCKKDYKGAIDEYTKIGEESDKYELIQNNMEAIYVHTGDYEKLCVLLALNKNRSEVNKLDIKTTCLLKAAKFMTPEDLERLIRKYPIEEIKRMNLQDEDDIYFHFSMRKKICAGLVAAGTIIHKIRKYAHRIGEDKFEDDLNIQRMQIAYDRNIVLLKALNSYNPIEFEVSFDEIALANRNWKDKTSLLYTIEYKKLLGKVIFDLLNPDLFPQINRASVVYHLLDVMCKIDIGFLFFLLSRFWNEIETAIKEGDFSLIEYINKAYGMILASKQDPYNLKERLQLLIDNTPEIDPKDSVKRSRIIYSLSQEGYDALIHAEHQYSLNDGKMGTENASELSLMFFKVFEIEYNKRLIRPMIKELNFTRLQQLYAESSEEWQDEIDKMQEINRTKRKMTLGEIRNLLYKIYDRDGQCSNIFINALYRTLTNEGIQAFLSKRMMKLISYNQIEKYRNPGAHTGYLTFSTATEAKEQVMTWIPVIGKWFKN